MYSRRFFTTDWPDWVDDRLFVPTGTSQFAAAVQPRTPQQYHLSAKKKLIDTYRYSVQPKAAYTLRC